MDFSEILIRNRDRIIQQWMTKLHKDVSPTYSAQPQETLLKTITAAADGNFAVLVDHDYSKIDEVIEWIGKFRSRDGFSLSEGRCGSTPVMKPGHAFPFTIRKHVGYNFTRVKNRERKAG